MTRKNRTQDSSKRTADDSRSADTSSAGKSAGKTRRKGAGQVRDPHAEREAQRYERPIPSREAILALLEQRGEMCTEAVIAEALAITDEYEVGALHKRLGAMVRDGQLLQGRRGGFAPAQKLDLIPGLVLANVEGYGFLRPDEGGDDLYLSPQQMRAVMHGDRVLASVVGVDRRGRKQGAIVEVLQRRSSRLVGRVVVENGVTVVVPDDRRLHPGRDDSARAGAGREKRPDRGGRDHRAAQRRAWPDRRDPRRAGRPPAAVAAGGNGNRQPRPSARMAGRQCCAMPRRSSRKSARPSARAAPTCASCRW